MTEADRPMTRILDADLRGQRLDQALASVFREFSRSRIQQWIRDGHVRIDGGIWRPRDRVRGGESVEIDPVASPQTRLIAQDLPLPVVHEDADLIVIDKPAGLVVHPAAGNPDRTLANALLHHDPELARIPRAGIVHRLDKDTTGLMVVARTLRAHKSLVDQLQARTVSRQYLAVANGVMTAGGTVDAPIGRHPVDRKRMAVVAGGKPAVTHYRVVERFRAHTWVRVSLETGRTHQIRVHLANIRHPLVGDRVYGGRPRVPSAADPETLAVLQGFPRQALHAARLELVHPGSGETAVWESAPAPDLRQLIEVLHLDMERIGTDVGRA
jgi:23S rRNA pseudouridine1911/1915/1917 synthase